MEAALKEGVYLVKPNLRELGELVRAPLENEQAWVEASRNLVEAGRAEIVVLTLGDKGALLVSEDHAWRAQAMSVKAVSAVGAGDSFLAGLVWGLASGRVLGDTFPLQQCGWIGGGPCRRYWALPEGRCRASSRRGGCGTIWERGSAQSDKL